MKDNERIASFGMKVEIKNDGRIHYTGVRARDQFGDDIFVNEWSEKGNWEHLELGENDVIIGLHGYFHMDW